MKVTQKTTLTGFLLSQGYKKNTIKTLLKYKNVYVDGQVQTHYAFLLEEGQNVEIHKTQQELPFPIIYEDKEIIVIDKPCGLLSEETNIQKEKTAYFIVKNYLQKKNESIYLVHRLDQYTSGILMFVKNKKLYQTLTHQWNECVKERGYITIVEGKMKQKKGIIQNYLTESKSQNVYITSKTKGKLAITHYKEIKVNKKYTMLQIHLETGRKNQIRVHLSSLHHPIVGDKKYGAISNPIKRLALHHHHFSFVHPLTYKNYQFHCSTPEEFNQLFSRK